MSLRSEVHGLIEILRDIEMEIGHVEEKLGKEDDVENAGGVFRALESEVKKLNDKIKSLGEKI